MSSTNEIPVPPRFCSEGEWLESIERTFAPISKVTSRRRMSEGEWLEQLENTFAASRIIVTVPQSNSMSEGEWLEWVESIYQAD